MDRRRFCSSSDSTLTRLLDENTNHRYQQERELQRGIVNKRKLKASLAGYKYNYFSLLVSFHCF